MERHVMWSPWTGPGLEHLYVTQKTEQVVADGLILGVEEQKPFRVRYEIHCDQHWRVRTVLVSVLGRATQTLSLAADGKGRWTSETGVELTSLRGCLDVDISATPFTNTLPIRRLALHPGQSALLSMVYISIPQMQVAAVEQRYTCLEKTTEGGRYLYESLEDGVSVFTAELPVDVDGLVGDYPGLFRRVGTW
jgi:uncharacterized protein